AADEPLVASCLVQHESTQRRRRLGGETLNTPGDAAGEQTVQKVAIGTSATNPYHERCLAVKALHPPPAGEARSGDRRPWRGGRRSLDWGAGDVPEGCAAHCARAGRGFAARRER